MTNLLIAYPDIPSEVATVTSGATMAELFSHWNLFSKHRYQHAKLNTAAATYTITFDLGPDYADLSNGLDFLYLARADILKANGVTQVVVQSSPDNSAWTTRLTEASFASATLYGPRSHDYIQVIAATSEFRYWRITYTATSCKFKHAAAWFGRLLDLGVDPEFEINLETPRDNVFRTDSGAEHAHRSADPRYTFDLTWTGVSDANAALFEEKIEARSELQSVALYTAANHTILDGQRLVQCELVRAIVRYVQPNWNIIEAQFRELLG